MAAVVLFSVVTVVQLAIEAATAPPTAAAACTATGLAITSSLGANWGTHTAATASDQGRREGGT
jgi:hypothetical protein